MTRILYGVLLTLCVVACAPTNGDQQFETQTNLFFKQFLKFNPEYATALGDHQYDHLLSDYSETGRAANRLLYLSTLHSLSNIHKQGLSTANQIDYDMLVHEIRGMIFEMDTLKTWEWNPMNYNPGSAIYSLTSRDFAPISERLKSIKSRLEQFPKVFDAGKRQLQNAPPLYVQTAIRQLKGTRAMVETGLDDFISQVPDFRSQIKPAQEIAVKSLDEFISWLETDLQPRATKDFRLGADLFRRKLVYTLNSDFSMEEILSAGQSSLAETHAEMYQVALPLFKTWFPKEKSIVFTDHKKVIKAVLNKLAEQRPTGETIVDQAKKDLAETILFTKEKNLITVPDDPVKIIVMPEFQRGVAVAYCDSPGPLEKNGETFYAISPPPSDWDAKRVESHFREYNNFMLKNLTVHEAVPGHYLQLALSNRYQSPTLIRSVFYSGVFVEGWATYAEQLMVEHGYGGAEVKMQQLKMKLRLIINSIIDQQIHAGTMTEQEAIALMMNEGFQEEGEAVGKWNRACLTSTQLSTYFVGNLEINDIRNRFISTNGAITDWKTFHDSVVSFGSPAPRYVKQLMGL